MADTAIAWCDKVWNALVGCSRVSPGCGSSSGGGCYAEREAYRLGFNLKTPQYAGLTRWTDGGARWTGEVRLVPEKLADPFGWKRPQRIFVASMSDPNHERVPDAWRDAMAAVVALAPHHSFLWLTKRAAEARRYFSDPQTPRRIGAAIMERGEWTHQPPIRLVEPRPLAGAMIGDGLTVDWPLPNVHLIFSAENQETADERIPILLDTPAAVRGVSLEPLLGPIELKPWLPWRIQTNGWNGPELHHELPAEGGSRGLDWVIVGSESGPRARAMNLAWAESIVAQCRAVRVPCFVKQIANTRDRKGTKPEFWPPGDWPQQFPEEVR